MAAEFVNANEWIYAYIPVALPHLSGVRKSPYRLDGNHHSGQKISLILLFFGSESAKEYPRVERSRRDGAVGSSQVQEVWSGQLGQSGCS